MDAKTEIEYYYQKFKEAELTALKLQAKKFLIEEQAQSLKAENIQLRYVIKHLNSIIEKYAEFDIKLNNKN